MTMETQNRAILAGVLLLTVGAGSAAAEPITVAYDVEIFRRFSRTQPGLFGTFEPFSQQFTLFMTFDPASGPVGGVYGQPTFSEVPLDLPPPPSAITLSSFGFTTHIALAAGGVHARAEGIFGGSGTVNGNLSVYDGTLRLMSTVLASDPPLAVTPETYPAHLALVTLNPFNFSYGVCLGIGPFPVGADACNDASGAGSLEMIYFGAATLRQGHQAPVPEPATFALVGGSLAILARYRRKLRAASGRT
jgi:hypothetical protein